MSRHVNCLPGWSISCWRWLHILQSLSCLSSLLASVFPSLALSFSSWVKLGGLSSAPCQLPSSISPCSNKVICGTLPFSSRNFWTYETNSRITLEYYCAEVIFCKKVWLSVFISLYSANNDHKIISKCLLQTYFGVQVLHLVVNQEDLVCTLSEGKYLTKRLCYYTLCIWSICA